METFTTPNIIAPHIQNWQVKSQNHLLKQGEHTTNNVVTNRSIILNATVEKTFAVTPSSQYEFSMDDITTYTPPTSPGGPGGGISLLVTNYDYTVRVYKGTSTTAFYTTQFNLSNATRAINFATDSTTSQIRIEISKGMAMIQGYSKYVDNLKLRKFTGNTSVYNTNYSNMSLTANALDGWSPDNWATTSATVDQSAGQYRLVAIGSGATAKVQREFTALPNQEHRFQYNLSLLNGGSTTVRVEQKVNGVYQYLATQQTQTTSGTYELSFVPSETDIRISVSGTSRYALQNLYLDRDQIDTLVATYALSRGYRYGYQSSERDDEVKGAGNSYTTENRQYDPRLGRWLSVDPLMDNFPWQSPYCAMDNNPIVFNDTEGLNGEDRIKRRAEKFAAKHNGIVVKHKDKDENVFYYVQNYNDVTEKTITTVSVKVFKNTRINKFLAFFTDGIPNGLRKLDKMLPKGKGGETTGGHPLTTKGDAVDPTKFRSKTAGREIDIDDLIGPLGGVKSGRAKNYFDKVKDFVDGLQKAAEVAEPLVPDNSDKKKSELGTPVGADSTDIDVYKTGAVKKQGIYTYRQSNESIEKGENYNDKNSRLIKTP